MAELVGETQYNSSSNALSLWYNRPMLQLNAKDFGRLDRFERIAALGMSSMHPGGMAATHRLIRETGLKAGTKLLDVGCGVGQTSCLLATRYGAEVTGVDRSARMILRAQARAQAKGAPVTFVEGDAYALTFPDEHFDLVFAESVTLFLDTARVLPELRRVLKPGGRIADIVMTCHEPVPSELLDTLEGLEGVRMNPRSEEEWRDAYAQAGFRIVYAEFHPSISDRSTAGSFFRDNGLGGLKAVGRMVGLLLTDPDFRAYVRDLGAFWKVHKRRFGYGLIVAERV